jgi:hypothetical protein
MAHAGLLLSHESLRSTRLFACQFADIVIARGTVCQAVVSNEFVAKKSSSSLGQNVMDTKAMANTSLSWPPKLTKSKRSPAKRNEGIASVLHLDLDVHRLRVFEKGVSVRHGKHR